MTAPNNNAGSEGGGPTPPRVEAHNSDELVDRLIARHGNAASALRALANETFDYRDRHRADQAKIAELSSKKFLADGQVAVAKDDADALAEYKKLGPHADVKTKLEAGAKAIEERDALVHKTTVREASDAHGWNATILADVIKKHEVDVEMREMKVEANGKSETKRVPFFKKRGKDAWEAADAFLEREDKVYLDVLNKTSDSDEEEEEEETRGRAPKQNPSVKGGRSTRESKTKVADDYISKRYKNPFAAKERE